MSKSCTFICSFYLKDVFMSEGIVFLVFVSGFCALALTCLLGLSVIGLAHRCKSLKNQIRILHEASGSDMNDTFTAAALEAATDGIIAIERTPSGALVTFANSAACAQIGKTRDEIIGQSIYDLFGSIATEECRTRISTALASGLAAAMEISLLRNEETGWFNLRFVPVANPGRDNDLMVAVLTETTQIKLHEAEFFQTRKLEALGQLAAGIAHDFNNILSVIDGFSRIALGKVPENDEMRGYLEKIRMAAERGSHLVRQMLTFSRHKIVTESVIDLAHTVREQETLLRPLVDASINLYVSIPDESIYVEGAADGIMQILMNLTVNARDAMPEGGTMSVEVRRCQPLELPPPLQDGKAYACLSVSDTGCGMEKSVKERIFDPFFTTKPQGKGTGLGLSMVYGLVKQAGGHIEVNSMPGEGTLMSVYLPLTDRRPQKEITGTLQNVENINLKGYTVLVAEDEPELLSMMCDMMQKIGMNVLAAANGNEVLALQDDYEGQIDLLLTDVIMPELDGIRAAEMLQAFRPETKVIFMSGYPAPGSMVRTEIPKDACFMAKPVQYEMLVRSVYEKLSGQTDLQSGGNPVPSPPRWKQGEIIQKSRGGT
jgi:two-component system, cell cycle sensor histidine kinase and response regulator CckA